MKKSIKIRLYRLHDKDLLSLIGTRTIKFQQIVYLALNAYCKKQNLVIELPPKRTTPIPKEQRGYTKILTLDTEKDAEILQMLDMVSDGYRNNFIKNILRLYIRTPLTEEFLVAEADESYFNERTAILHTSSESNIVIETEKVKSKPNISSTNVLENPMVATKEPVTNSPLVNDPSPHNNIEVEQEPDTTSETEQNIWSDDDNQDMLDLLSAL